MNIYQYLGQKTQYAVRQAWLGLFLRVLEQHDTKCLDNDVDRRAVAYELMNAVIGTEDPSESE